MRLASIAFALALAAPPLSLAPSTAVAKDPGFVVAAVRVVDGEGVVRVDIKPDGKVYARSEVLGDTALHEVGALKPDGVVYDHEGFFLAGFDDQGRMMTEHGTVIATVAADGSAVNPDGRRLGWAADGTLAFDRYKAHLEPADSKARRAASATLILFVLSEEVF